MKYLLSLFLFILTIAYGSGQELSMDSLRAKFGSVNDFIGNQNVTIAYKNGYGAMINKQGQQLTPYLYTQNFTFYDCDHYEKTQTYSNLAVSPAVIGHKIGLIDTNGVIKIPVMYDAILPVSAKNSLCSPISYVDSFYFVTLNCKVGMIDRKNRIIIPIVYDGISRACGDLVRLYKVTNIKNSKQFNISCGWANHKGHIYAKPTLPTTKCTYAEWPLRTYPTTYGCENAKGHPCDPIPLECKQCQQECPTAKELMQMKQVRKKGKGKKGKPK